MRIAKIAPFSLISILLVVFSNALAAEADYPPPPVGIHWGWQTQILFDLNSAKLHEEYKSGLTKIAAILKRHPEVSLLITGRADNTGDLAYNRRLSQKRIQGIMTYLTQKGVAPQRIHTQALGEQRPISSNACFEDRQRNRRADLAFFPTGTSPPVSSTVEGDTQPIPGECEQFDQLPLLEQGSKVDL